MSPAPVKPPAREGRRATEVLAPDPLPLLKGFAALRRLTGMYPAGHPMITQKLKELDDLVQRSLRNSPTLCIDIIHGDVHLDGVAYRADNQTTVQIVGELLELGVHSIHIQRGVDVEELRTVCEFLWQMKEDAHGEAVGAQLARRGVRHVSLGRIVSLDTRWRGHEYPEAPTGPLDPAYAESLDLAQKTFENVGSGRDLDLVTVRDLVQLLIERVARSNAALAQILAVKQYENLTYCHSVNVAMISLLLGRRLRFDEDTIMALVEGALLHDIGKTRVPVEIVKKPGALDKRERKTIEAHTTFGAEILMQTEGVRAMTPIVALEHHRRCKGGGYPDLGDSAIPHVLTQIVSVADVYEAITGARSYQQPKQPDQACLILARLSGEHLNTAVVKAFVNTVTFFPIGSLVQTNRGERGVVVRTNPSDPLHPVLVLIDAAGGASGVEIDTSVRDASGVYARHVVETLNPEEGQIDLATLLSGEPAAN